MRVSFMKERSICRDRKEQMLYTVDLIVLFLGLGAIGYRILLGIDFTDQGWYVAEPYIVAEGAVPYVNNWTQVPRFTLPLALLFKVYIILQGGGRRNCSI